MQGQGQPENFVTISGVTKKFGDFTALDALSFSVREGGTLALLGPSGCGKTTMLRCLAGLETPESGFISIAGKVVFDSVNGINLNPEERGLGVVFQSYAVWPHMSVVENVEFPLRVRGISKDERRARAMEILDIVGLGQYAERSATQLSGGQQQRVALARALVHKPALVLFDEALSNLDAALREHMRLELKALQDKLGFTALYVTHDQGEALGLAETIILMNAGRIDTSGLARDVFMNHRTIFAARFFGLNVIDCAALPEMADLPAIVIAFQREHARITRADGPAEDGNLILSGRIVTRSFQGLVDEYAVEISDRVSVRVLDGDGQFAPGEQVKLVIDRKNLFLLDH